MFDKFKKIDEKQNNVELNTVELCENIRENCREEIQSGELNPSESCENGEENHSGELKTQVALKNTGENALSMLEALGGEERALLAEKSQLMTMEETLKQRIIEEIQTKKHIIENLKYEIPELRQRCEALAKALKIPVQK